MQTKGRSATERRQSREADSTEDTLTPGRSDGMRIQQLCAFLRNRRAALRPEDCGLPAGRRRRTPGLRREEVASIADVGVTWYTWLEQGREIRVSGDALERIASALRLNPAEELYLFSLAGVAHASPSAPPTALSPVVDVQAILDALELPALVYGPTFDVVAFNCSADALYDFGGCAGPFANNHAWRFFKDPKRKALYVNWEPCAVRVVGILRTRLARYAGDQRLERLLAELRSDADFVRIWERAAVLPQATFDLIFRHSRFKEIRVRSTHLVVGASDYAMATLVPADASSACALEAIRRQSVGSK